MKSKFFRGPERYDEYQAWMTSEQVSPLGIFCHSDQSLEIQFEPPEEPPPNLEKVHQLVPRSHMEDFRALAMPYGYKQKGNSSSECALCA